MRASERERERESGLNWIEIGWEGQIVGGRKRDKAWDARETGLETGYSNREPVMEGGVV